ncbi:MAG: hypothetical protein O3C07_04690 [Bacteroidetes bacterium]|nr:hypothetical protein [Bacteroidota bacterium]
MTVRDLGLLAVTVNELVDRIAEQKFIVSIEVDNNELVIKYSDGTVNSLELPILESGIITKELDPIELEKVIENLLKQEIEQRLQNIIDSVVKLVPKPEKGEDGQSVDEKKIIESLQTAIAKKLESELEKIKQSIPKPIRGEDGKDADEEKIIENLKSVLLDKLESELVDIRKSIPEPIVPKDGRDADEEAIKASLLKVINAELKTGLEKIIAEIPAVKDGVDGKNADEQAIIKVVEAKLADKVANIKQELSSQITEIIKQSIPDVKDGRDGRDADQDAIVGTLTKLINKHIEEQKTTINQALQSELSKAIQSIPAPKDGRDGINGRDADENKVISALQDKLGSLASSAIDKLQQDLRSFIADTINEIKSSFKPIKGDKGEAGVKGDRGNGIKDAKIDSRDHLIIKTDDKVIDAGEVSKKFFSSFGFSYTNELPMPFDVGGFKKGTRFKDVELKVLWTKLLYGYDLPYFSAFTVGSLPKKVEVGYKIAAGTYSVGFTITNPELLKEDSITLSLNDNLVLTNLPNTSPVDLVLSEDIKRDLIGAVSFEIRAYDTTGTSFSKSFAVNYMHKVYWGAYGVDLTDVGGQNPLQTIFAPNPSLGNQGGIELCNNINDREYLYVDLTTQQALVGAYRWFCYPAIFGENYIFYDLVTDIALVFEEKIELNIVNEYGINIKYYCYRTENEIFNQFIMKIKNG